MRECEEWRVAVAWGRGPGTDAWGCGVLRKLQVKVHSLRRVGGSVTSRGPHGDAGGACVGGGGGWVESGGAGRVPSGWMESLRGVRGQIGGGAGGRRGGRVGGVGRRGGRVLELAGAAGIGQG